MFSQIHFLRPMWFYALLPIGLFVVSLFLQRTSKNNWAKVCDPHLLKYLLKNHNVKQNLLALILLTLSFIFMIIALSGPTWSKINVPTFQQIQPRIVLLDMSDDMLNSDLSPNRLVRAKFKLHDLLSHNKSGQFGLIAYTDEPFVVSPLTEDSQTIDNLLPALTPDTMPVSGNDLQKALLLAQELIKSSGSKTGDVLVLTAKIPTDSDVFQAKTLKDNGIRVSVIPMLKDNLTIPYFQPLTKSANGHVISFTNDDKDINKWLKSTNVTSSYQVDDLSNFPIWQDEGRIFLAIALLLLLPIFRRNWLLRIYS